SGRRAAVERCLAEPAGRNRLQCPLRRPSPPGLPDDRVCDVERSGDESADKNTKHGAPHGKYLCFRYSVEERMVSPSVDGENRSLREMGIVETNGIAGFRPGRREK